MNFEACLAELSLAAGRGNRIPVAMGSLPGNVAVEIETAKSNE